MHSMQPVVTNVCGVCCPSVCLSRGWSRWCVQCVRGLFSAAFCQIILASCLRYLNLQHSPRSSSCLKLASNTAARWFIFHMNCSTLHKIMFCHLICLTACKRHYGTQNGERSCIAGHSDRSSSLRSSKLVDLFFMLLLLYFNRITDYALTGYFSHVSFSSTWLS